MVDKKQIDLSKKYWSPLREEKKRAFALRTSKWCNHCRQMLPFDEFYPPSSSGLTRISAWCRKCICEYARERWDKKHPGERDENGHRIIDQRLRVHGGSLRSVRRKQH
jgi:hypothetical protein